MQRLAVQVPATGHLRPHDGGNLSGVELLDRPRGRDARAVDDAPQSATADSDTFEERRHVARRRDIDRFDLFIMAPDGTNLERLTIRAGDNERPSWSPNGQLVVFHSNRTKGRDVKGVPSLFVMNRDGSAQRPLNTGLYESQTPCWGPPTDQ